MAEQDEREVFEKLIPRIGSMTHWHIFQAGADYARAALAATPAAPTKEQA